MTEDELILHFYQFDGKSLSHNLSFVYNIVSELKMLHDLARVLWWFSFGDDFFIILMRKFLAHRKLE